MNSTDLIKALKNLKVQTGSLACLGCWWEHNCSTQGCRIIREAAAQLEAMLEDLKNVGDCSSCKHDRLTGFDPAVCVTCKRGENWEWRGLDENA